MNINFDNNIPIYIQLVEYFKFCIISGKYEAGERLASVRDLAMEAKVNPNTVQKALAELEEFGLVYTDSTNGRYVTNDKKLIMKCKKEYALSITAKYVNEMKNLGFSEVDIDKFIGG